MPHTDTSAPRMTVFPRTSSRPRKKVANGDAVHYLEADVRLAGGRGGGETPPAPKTTDFLYSIAEFSLIQALARHKPSKSRFFAPPRRPAFGRSFQKGIMFASGSDFGLKAAMMVMLSPALRSSARRMSVLTAIRAVAASDRTAAISFSATKW